MSRSSTDSPTQALVDADIIVLNLIKSKKNLGISIVDVKKQAKLAPPIVDKSFKSLVKRNLIKHIPTKGRNKLYMAVEFEPCEEVTGGAWYSEGKLDKKFIDDLKGTCLKVIQLMKVATAEGIYEFLKKRKVVECCTSQQIGEILNSMVLDDDVIEVKSSGLGEYHSIPVGLACYRAAAAAGGDNTGPKTIGQMASIPCGVCPRINQCTPDGIISPQTCVYYTKWLNFEF